MGFRFGSHKRKEKQPVNEKNEKPKNNGKNKKENDKSSARPPPAPGSLKSTESRTPGVSNVAGSHTASADASSTILSTPSNRNVLFRDNRFPDGTTMPRIPTSQPHIMPPGADREGRISPTGSIYSTGSLQAPFPSLSSYPASYVPQTHSKPCDPALRPRNRFHSDGVYRSIYGDPLPKPDYPLSNDGTGNSNRDSGLESESRSSSGGKPAFTNIFDIYPQQGSPPHRSRHLSIDRSGGFFKFAESPQIFRPKGYQGNRDGSNFYQTVYSTPPRNSRPFIPYYGDNYQTSATPRRFVRQNGDFEEETYRPQSTHRPIHCSSCSCAEDTVRAPRCGSSLSRVQLEDETLVETRWDASRMSGKCERRFRREDEDEYSTGSMLRGLPRNQPVRGGYFEEEREEVDRYGRLPPVKRPISARLPQRSFYDDNRSKKHNEADDDDFHEDESDYSGEDGLDFQETSRNFVSRKHHPGFYEMSKSITLANRDTSVIRL